MPKYRRERVETPDDDFLDLDWLENGHDRLVILCHGLEGNSRRVYMSGMAHTLSAAGWDVLAWNYRGCSGEPNRQLITYHSGFTADLAWLIERVRAKYERLALAGFSLGGNMILKYLGEQGGQAPVDRAAVFSVPCDLAGSSAALSGWAGRPYMARFMRSLRPKILHKAAQFPGQVSTEGLQRIKTFGEFDDAYTAPINGFRDAEDYWAQSSSRPYIPRIQVPTLMVSALDDPFLSPSCYPHELAEGNPNVRLLTPRWGGHVGFAERVDRIWSEPLAVQFLGA
ncbi:MAG: alpha/beta fold hydrolase [Rhodothermales bacterium]|nr:alpha/beta fold hydrolase [Rhodothermales bacterium]